MGSVDWLVGVCAAAALSWTSTAHALSMTVVPADHRIEVAAGGSETREITVTNNGTGSITVTSYSWDWWYQPDGSHQFAPPGTFDRSGATWVDIFPREMVVPAGQTSTLTVSVEMPQDTQGGYYAVAFIEARAGAMESQGAAIRPGGRIAVPLLMQAEGTETHAVRLVDTDITPPSATQPLKLAMRTLNVGDTHEFPEFMGAIRSTDDARFVGRFRGHPTRILPGQERSVGASWSGDLAPGSYEVVGSLIYSEGRTEAVREAFSIAAKREEDDGSLNVWLP